MNLQTHSTRKKPIALLLLLGLLAISAQGQILKKTYYDLKRTRVDELYYVNQVGQYNGLYTKYSEFGSKILEATFKNGVKEGPAKEYYIRGAKSKLKQTGTFKNDEKDGVWTTYTYVKDGESYFLLLQSWGSGGIEDDVFNYGIQTKFMEEHFEKGKVKKEIQYHLSGKLFQIKQFGESNRITGEYTCFNQQNQLITKGKILENGRMSGEWIIPREESGSCPSNKESIDEVVYTQKLLFDKEGNLDTNYISKSYYLSGKIKDSVRVLSLEHFSGYDYNNRWTLCGKNKLVSGPYKSYYENGKLEEEGTFTVINGQSVKTGIWKTYNRQGILISEQNLTE